MNKGDFERQINVLVPQPDPETTAALFEFYQELGEEPGCFTMRDLFNSLHFISRHFNAEVTQKAYEIIRHGAAFPGEMVAAAFHMANGCDCTPQQMAQAAEDGMLMCFYTPKDPEEISPLAICIVKEKSMTSTYYTMDFGTFDPEAALQKARQDARGRKTSVTDALLLLTVDMELKPVGGTRKILMYDSWNTVPAMDTSFSQFPALAARITFDMDRNQTTVEYNPLWLGLRQQQESARGGMMQAM